MVFYGSNSILPPQAVMQMQRELLGQGPGILSPQRYSVRIEKEDVHYWIELCTSDFRGRFAEHPILRITVKYPSTDQKGGTPVNPRILALDKGMRRAHFFRMKPTTEFIFKICTYDKIAEISALRDIVPETLCALGLEEYLS